MQLILGENMITYFIRFQSDQQNCLKRKEIKILQRQCLGEKYKEKKNQCGPLVQLYVVIFLCDKAKKHL